MDRTDDAGPQLVPAAELLRRAAARRHRRQHRRGRRLEVGRLAVRPRTWRPFPGARVVELDVRVVGWRYLVVRAQVSRLPADGTLSGGGVRRSLEAATGRSS